MTTSKRKYIEVIKVKCVKCGKKVTDHHILCNFCWGKTAKRKSQQARRKILDKAMKAQNRKFKERDAKKQNGKR